MNKTARELADHIGGRIEGDPAVEVRGVASPERAGLRDLIYVEAAKHAGRAVASPGRGGRPRECPMTRCGRRDCATP